MAEHEQGFMRVLAESRTQPEIEGIGALSAFARIINRQRAQGLLLGYLANLPGGDPAQPQKVAFAVDRISAILESPGHGAIDPHPDLEVRELVEPIRVARDAIRRYADQMGVTDDTDEALAVAAVPTQHASGTELRAACNAALDAHDAALVILACWYDAHPARSVSRRPADAAETAGHRAAEPVCGGVLELADPLPAEAKDADGRPVERR
jgi:hypothetical protein